MMGTTQWGHPRGMGTTVMMETTPWGPTMTMGTPNGFGDHPMWLGTSQLGKGTPNEDDDHHDGGDHPVGTHHDDGNPPMGTPNGFEELPMGLGTHQLGKGTPNRSEDQHAGGNHPMGTHHDGGHTQWVWGPSCGTGDPLVGNRDTQWG